MGCTERIKGCNQSGSRSITVIKWLFDEQKSVQIAQKLNKKLEQMNNKKGG